MALVNMTAGNSYTFKKENNNSIVSFATDEAHQKKHMAAGAHIGVASVTTTDWTNVNPMLTTHCTLTAASFKSITSNIAIPIIQISNENGSNNSADTNIQWYNANQNKYSANINELVTHLYKRTTIFCCTTSICEHS